MLDREDRQVATDQNAHTLSIIAAIEIDNGGKHLLSQEYGTDGEQQTHSTLPRQCRLLVQDIDGIHRTV